VKSARRHAPVKDADTRALEHDLSRVLGLKVEIDHGKGEEGRAGGRVTIRYRSLEQLDDVIRRLNRDG
jgi:ParB family chromosome partitioning protein